MKAKTRKRLRIIAITVALLLAFSLAGFAWLSTNYESQIKQKLNQVVLNATDSVYHIDVGNAFVSIARRKIELNDVRLTPDINRLHTLQQRKKGSNLYYSLKIPLLQITGINWWGLLGDIDFASNQILVSKPVLTITHNSNMEAFANEQKTAESAIDRFYTSRFRVDDATVTYQEIRPADTSTLIFEEGDIVLRDWEFMPEGENQDAKFAFAERGRISFGSVRQKEKPELYKVSCRRIAFSSSKKRLRIRDLVITPKMGRENFYHTVGHRQEMFDVRFPIITLTGVNWQQFFRQGSIVADRAVIDSASVNIFQDLRLPSSGSTSEIDYPFKMLLQFTLPVYVKTTILREANVSYTELSGQTKRTGSIVFDHIKGRISNLTNLPDYIDKDSTCRAIVNGKFNGPTDVRVKLNCSLKDTSGRFNLLGKVKNLSAGQVTDATEALALLRINSLKIDSADIRMNGDGRAATGNYKIIYHDLKITIQKQDTVRTVVQGRGFPSFIANKALLYNENPENDIVRHSKSHTIKTAGMSFFGIIWAGLSEGAINTAARNEDVAELVK